VKLDISVELGSNNTFFSCHISTEQIIWNGLMVGVVGCFTLFSSDGDMDVTTVDPW